MSQYPYQGQDPNQQPPYGGYTPNPTPTGGQPQQPYTQQPPYGQPQQPYTQQPPYGQPQQPYTQPPPYGQPQAPYGQNPYGQQQVPQYGQVPGGKQALHPGYLTAAIGGIVAFIAFFLPYIVASYSAGALGSYSVSASGSNGGGQFWLEPLLALVAIAIAALLQYGSRLGASTNQSVQKLLVSLSTKQRNWIMGLIAAGTAALVLHLLFMLSSFSSFGNYSGVAGISVGWGIGAWLFLLASIAIVIGGILALRPDLLARVQKR